MGLLDLREPFSAGSHALGLALSVPATALLLRRSRGDRPKQLSLLVFGLSLAACYLASALYHGVRVGPAQIGLYERLDHVGIHLLIAGSYTPLAWNLLTGRWRVGTLAAVWGASLFGSALLLADVRIPVSVRVCEYLAMGWGSVFCYFEAARAASHRALRPLVVGGVLYSVGAVLYLLHWPDVWPGVVGAHGVFHLWVMGGSFAHFRFMLTVVAPFALVPAAAAGELAAASVMPQPDRVPVRVRVHTGWRRGPTVRGLQRHQPPWRSPGPWPWGGLRH